MNKEEAKEYLDNYRKIYAELAPESFLEALDIMLNEPSLPSNLDEAAKKYADGENPTCSCEECLIKTFKAGAEWCNAQIPKLPDNVDEAAEKYADTQNKNFLKPEIVKNIFKAGAEWIAGQGASFNTKVGWIDGPTVLDWPDDILDKFEMSDEVIVQIRKKQL